MSENRSSSPGVKDNAESSASPRSEDVLRSIGLNVCAEDADLALARTLQEQERAFMLFAAQHQQHQRASSSAAEPATQGTAGRAGSSSAQQPGAASEVVVLSEDEADYVEDEEDDDGEEPGDSVSDGDEEGVALTDEELALQLQTEEHHAHMLELAGFGAEGLYADDELDDEECYPEDEVDPDNMTYEELQALGDAVGTVSKGVPRAVVDALSRSRYSMPAPASGNQGGRRRSKGSRSPAAEPDKCAVCQMEYEDGDEVVTLPCTHFYHPDCIGQWLQDRKVCPVCGKELVLQKPKAASQRHASAATPPMPGAAQQPDRPAASAEQRQRQSRS